MNDTQRASLRLTLGAFMRYTNYAELGTPYTAISSHFGDPRSLLEDPSHDHRRRDMQQTLHISPQ